LALTTKLDARRSKRKVASPIAVKNNHRTKQIIGDDPVTDKANAPTLDPRAQADDYGFQADVARLLELMTHSVYSERDIFLRELISNSADACEKLRYEALANEQLAAEAGAPLVTIALDKAARTLSVADNGVGMSRDDLVAALGTIASSGTRAFLDKLAADNVGDENRRAFIGQFGIGFYSAFMVAENVEVVTRRAGSNEAFIWTSDGKGSYQIAAADSERAPKAGTTVTLHLKTEADEFLEPYQIERIVREHSGAIALPIDLIEEPGKEPRRLTDGVALWTKPKSEITQEEYTDFYRQLAGQFDDPALTVHWRAEGRTEYTVLAFIPGSRPLDLFDPARKGKSKLYVRRVLISREFDLLPAWLRFARVVVDSADIPLNVSREMVQQSPIIASIGKGIATRILQEIGKLAESDPEKFASIWENFGAVLKEGLHEDPQRRDAIFEIARFASTTVAEKKRTLKDYVANLRPNQTAIYYITGDDLKRLAASPQLEGFRARGVEVLLLDDPVDAFWVTSAIGFDGKPFKSATQGEADIGAIPLAEGAENLDEADKTPEMAKFAVTIKEILDGHVEDVRLSTRLRESASCLVAPDFGLDRQLSRLLSGRDGGAPIVKPVLEINPRHAVVAALAKKAEIAERKDTEDGCFMLLDLARIADGEQPVDASAFARRLCALLAKSAD
jgi:molecular chaperone HtpG